MRMNSFLSAPSFSARVSQNTVLRYTFASAAVLIAFLLSRALHPWVGDRAAYVLPLPAVAFSAWYCGLGASILATVLALLGATFGSTLPIASLRILSVAEFVPALLFLLSCVIVIAM